MSVDFEKSMYTESIDVLEHHLRPFRSLPGVVLEQTYLDRMAEGVKPLALLAAENTGRPTAYLHQNRHLEIT